jgi:hypothetical protein
MAHVALPELRCSSLFCGTPFATESYRRRLVGRVSIMDVPPPQNRKEMKKDAVTVKHFQAANHPFCSQGSEDYQSISSTYSAATSVETLPEPNCFQHITCQR